MTPKIAKLALPSYSRMLIASNNIFPYLIIDFEEIVNFLYLAQGPKKTAFSALPKKNKSSKDRTWSAVPNALL